MNKPAKSKINYTAAFQAAVNVGVYFLANNGIIPQDAVVDALVIGNTFSAMLIATFRTWFTSK